MSFHFDGHGTSGAIFFENLALDGNAQPVPAAELGKLLRETAVPVLILNACRSAHAEPPQQPEQAPPVHANDLHEQIRAFGSLAHAVMDYGASGVVAWRYNVYVSTAAQFMADFYAALASGLSLGEAATLARKQLDSASRPIEDWTVPVVFEATPVRLFPETETGSRSSWRRVEQPSRACPRRRTSVSSGAIRRFLSWTGCSIHNRSSCCTRTRAAGKQAPPWSSLAGTNKRGA
jgi:CHAT domain-containing protein